MKLHVITSLLVIGTLSGCQTPNHTNTLIFGTNTKIALDVSQDPTGVVGVTLGYKRQEAVWMPLLANSKTDAAKDGTPSGFIPADCKDATTLKTMNKDGSTSTRTSGCKFSGTAGSDSTNGAGAEDTYSVLATFSGEGKGVAGTAAGKPEASAGGSLAQFFATGLAARVLAEQGSSIVNTTGGSKNSNASTPKKSDAIDPEISAERSAVDRIIYAVTDKNGALMPDKLEKLSDSATFKDGSIKNRIIAIKKPELLKNYLLDTYENAAKPLFNAIP
jgi:hypothetical protein